VREGIILDEDGDGIGVVDRGAKDDVAVFEGPGDLDRKASITGETSSLETDVA